MGKILSFLGDNSIAALIAGLFGLAACVGGLVAAYIGIYQNTAPIKLIIEATQTAEAKLTSEVLLVAAPTATPVLPTNTRVSEGLKDTSIGEPIDTPTTTKVPKPPTSTPAPAPTNTPKPTNTPRPAPTPSFTPQPSDTPLPTGTPSPLSSICDGFDYDTLNSGWNWIDPKQDSTYSLTANPGFLRITVYGRDHDLYQNLNAPRMLQDVDGNFAVTTKITINPKKNYQGAGLLFWQDENNYVRLERTLVLGIDLLYKIQGIYKAVEIPFSASTVFLKFEFANQNLQGFYSEDGFNWVSTETLQLPLSNNNQVGVVVVNEWQDDSISADFDYFRFSECQ